jgi:simple sugar transport system ATP-binding protein
MSAIALETRSLSKSYGAVHALRSVDFVALQGQVTAICGDNGAGKSTLIRVLSGAHEPSSGEMLLLDRPVKFSSPHDALKQGIATIYQDLAVAPTMSIWQNIFMGIEQTHRWIPGLPLLNKTGMRAKALQLMQSLNQDVQDMDRAVNQLSGGQRQSVAIARALLWQARIIIMDEPTAALGVKESAEVLALIGKLKESGVAVILISHNMDDVVAVADQVFVLKAGRQVARMVAKGLSAQALSQTVMSGRYDAMATQAA